MLNRTRARASLGVVAGVLLCLPGLGAEFSAEMVTRSPAMGAGSVRIQAATFMEKLYVKGGRMRIEDATPEAEMAKMPLKHARETTIRLQGRHLLWVVSPETKTYAEFRGRAAKDALARRQEPIETDRARKQVGREKCGGYDCDKYRMSWDVRNEKVGATMWYSRRLGLPVKIVDVFPSGTVITELRNVQEKPQPDSLFELPKGYRKQPPSKRDHGGR